MATNLVFKDPDNLLLTVAGVSSGNPVAVGGITGVALTNTGDDGKSVIRRNGVFELNVEGINMVFEDPTWVYANSAVSVGDKLYYDASRPIKINKNDHSGVFFGYALEAVAEGASDTIQVLLK